MSVVTAVAAALVNAGAVVVVDRMKQSVALVNAGVAVVKLARSLYMVVVALVNAAAAVVKLARSLYMVVVALVNAGVAVVTNTVMKSSAAVVALVNAGVAVVVDAMTCDLPSTSIYTLTVDVDSTQYGAGVYLVRDNGVWSNVYLTPYARALMGDSVDVIALTSASVIDDRGTSHVWHVAIA
jgi:hypothetical protein